MSDIRGRRQGGAWKDIRCDEQGIVITHPLYIDETLHPLGRGAATSTGAQFCTEFVQTSGASTYDTVEQVLVDFGYTGKIIELEFGLTGGFRAANATADLIYQWQAKSVGQTTWVNLHSAVTKTDINTTVVEETYSGIFGVSTGVNPLTQLPSRYLSTVPFEVRLLIQSNGAAGSGKGKTKNSSYVKVKFIPD